MNDLILYLVDELVDLPAPIFISAEILSFEELEQLRGQAREVLVLHT